MNAWSNIEILPQDSEIIEINKFEKTLGDIPVHDQQIRELITRFEVCHFKYQQHFRNIKKSINIVCTIVFKFTSLTLKPIAETLEKAR